MLPDNPVRALPRKQIVKLTSAGANASILPIGRKVSTGAVGDLEDNSITGIIEGKGAPITSSEIVTRGKGYSFSNANNIPLVSLTGSGENATANFTILSDGAIDSITLQNSGNRLQVGEVLTFDNSNVNV